jgi:opacity protein-like surface antigen
MHRSIRLAGFAALIALPLSAQAQMTDDIRPVQFGISAGLTMPMGDVGDAFESGFNVTGHVWYRPGTFANLSFRGDVGFDRFQAKDIVLAGIRSKGTLTAIGGVANAVYSFPQTDASALLRPYVLVGVGLYNTRQKVTLTVGEGGGTEEAEDTDTNFGLQGGAGLQFNLSGFSTFAEAKFVNVFTDGSSARWVPISFGVRF